MLRRAGSRRGSRVRFSMFGRTQTTNTNPENCAPDLPDLFDQPASVVFCAGSFDFQPFVDSCGSASQQSPRHDGLFNVMIRMVVSRISFRSLPTVVYY